MPLVYGVISATGKVEGNADRIAHVSPRISGKIVSVRASLGDSVSVGQALATLEPNETDNPCIKSEPEKRKNSRYFY